MSFDTSIRVEDPVDAYELFAAAREAAAARDKDVKWALTDCGDGIHLLQTTAGTASTVNVQFPAAAGGQIPDWDEDGRLDGYALVSFTRHGVRPPDWVMRARHRRLVRKVGVWLDGQGARWSWLADPDEVWLSGSAHISRQGKP